MDFKLVQPDVIKYEMRNLTGEDPLTAAQKKPGGFGRFLSGLGRVLGAIAAPLSIIFPPAMIGALGAYGVSQIGDRVQGRAYQKMAENQQKSQVNQQVSFPGLDIEGFGYTSAERMGDVSATPVQAAVMDTLFARNKMMVQSAKSI